MEGFDFEGQWIEDPHWDCSHRWEFDTEHDSAVYYGFPANHHDLWLKTDTKEWKTYQMLKDMFLLAIPHDDSPDIYDVDMFRHDILEKLFTETDPQDIDEDDYLIFQMILVYMIHDEDIFRYYGPTGCAVLHADLMHDGENYYVNKTPWKEA